MVGTPMRYACTHPEEKVNPEEANQKVKGKEIRQDKDNRLAQHQSWVSTGVGYKRDRKTTKNPETA
jgi:hypothetical protein